MNRMALTLIIGATLASLGCATEPNDRLIGDIDPNSLAADGNTQHHFQDPNSGENGISDPNEVKAEDEKIGSPEVVARLHSCSKITYDGLGSILQSRGVDLGSTQKNSASQLYKTGKAALGTSNYAGRVPEAVIASTAALSKQFDIFVAAAMEIQTKMKDGTLDMTACPGTQLVDGQGKFTQDGLSCLMGKPATPDHVNVANDAVTEAQNQGLTMDEGQQIAIASLLEAAHTCE